MNPTLWNEWLTRTPSAVALISVLLLLLIGVLAGLVQNGRRNQLLLTALDNSWRGRAKPLRPINWRGFAVTLDPPPDPYVKFEARFTAFSYFSLIDLLLRSGGGAANMLQFTGKLANRPHQEVLWMRGRPAGRALGRSGDPALWQARRIDLLNGDFAVRGVNTSAIEHAFFDLQARYGPFLQKVSLQADEPIEMELMINAGQLTAEDIPGLVAALRGLGRAGMR